MCRLRTQNPSNFMHFLHIFEIVVNFLPFALVDPGPADSSAGFGAKAGAGAQPGDSVAAGEGAHLMTFPEVGDFHIRYVHVYGKVVDVEAGMVFLVHRCEILHWKIFRGISVRPLRAKTRTGRERGGDSVTLFCLFWVKHKKEQEAKVFLVPFLYVRPPSSHTWALPCTQHKLGQLQKVCVVPLSEIGGLLPGTREVGGEDQKGGTHCESERLLAEPGEGSAQRMSRKVEAGARKLAQGEEVASESSTLKMSSMDLGKRSPGRPPKAPGKVLGVTGAVQTSQLLRLQSENEFAEENGGAGGGPGCGALCCSLLLVDC